MNKDNVSAISLKKAYIIALLVIFALATVKYIALEVLVIKEGASSVVINLSGRQRMLSQRIVFLSYDYMKALDEQAHTSELTIKKNLLLNSIDEFENNHRDLILGNSERGLPKLTNQKVFEVYYSGHGNLDHMMNAYISAARNILSDQTGYESKLKDLKFLQEVGLTDLLEQLNMVVALHEENARDRVHLIEYLQFIFYVLTAIILLLEARYIFHPLTRSIGKTVGDLRKRERINKDHLFELERFTHIAAHHLREPTQKIINFAQLLDMNKSSAADGTTTADGKVKEETYTRYILDGGKQMMVMLDGLHSYARLSSQELHKSNVRARDALDTALEKCSRDYDMSLVDLDIYTLPEVYYDRGMLEKLFYEILDNALKFNSSERKKVKISARDQKTHWVFSVQDNGVGIRSSALENIFSMFYKAYLRDEYYGVGVGLSLCRKIVELHQGRIWAESEYSSGSEILFTIVK